MRLRRFAVSVLALMLLSVVTPRAHARFFDVELDHPYFDAIHFLLHHGIVRGYENRSFRPENAITRAEFVKILVSVLYPEDYIKNCLENLPEHSEVIPHFLFPDVPKEAWFTPYICTAWINGIVSGHPDGTFRPIEGVKVVEAAKMLALGFELTALELPDLGEQNVLWYEPYIELLAQQNALPATIKDVTYPLLRGEMAEMVYRLKDVPITLEPVDKFSLQTEDIVYPVQWETYEHEKFGIAFDAPNVWEKPIPLPRGKVRELPNVQSAWTLYFGPEPEGCTGTQRCVERDMWIDAYNYKHADVILDDIEMSERILEIVSQDTVNDLTVVIFYEEDDCSLKRAFIFGRRNIYSLSMRCGKEDASISHLFDRLLRTFTETTMR